MGGALSRKSSAIVLKRDDSRNKMPLPKPKSESNGAGGEDSAAARASSSQMEDMENLPKAPSRPPRSTSNKKSGRGGGAGEVGETSLAVHSSGGEEQQQGEEESRFSSSTNNNNNNNNNAEAEMSTPARRAPTPEPVVELPPAPVIGDGGYLVFTTISDGTLTLHFSPDEVQGSLAYFKPMKIVPAFKYRQNAGRQEIIRKLINNQRGYYDGFAQFIKAGKEFNAELYLFRNCKARVYYFVTSTSEVCEVPLEKFVPILQMDFVAVIPPECYAFKGIKKMSSDAFVSTGSKFGSALPLDLISRKSMRVNDSSSPLVNSGKERFSPHA